MQIRQQRQDLQDQALLALKAAREALIRQRNLRISLHGLTISLAAHVQRAIISLAAARAITVALTTSRVEAARAALIISQAEVITAVLTTSLAVANLLALSISQAEASLLALIVSLAEVAAAAQKAAAVAEKINLNAIVV